MSQARRTKRSTTWLVRKPRAGQGWQTATGGKHRERAGGSYTNAIGAPYLSAYWKDPDFDAKQRAFYYVRVMEIPTPRWTTYDAKVFGVELPTDVPASIQDRAYTSPIWYTRSGRGHHHYLSELPIWPF